MVVTKNLTKIFASGNKQVIALNEVTLNIKRGDFILIKGKSGCGKSTLLFTLGGMLIPSDGFVNVSGQDIYALSESQRTRYRAKNIGFVFQSYYLFPYLSVLENMMMPGRVNKTAFSQSEVEQFAKELNIADRLQHKPVLPEYSHGHPYRRHIKSGCAIQRPLPHQNNGSSRQRLHHKQRERRNGNRLRTNR